MLGFYSPVNKRLEVSAAGDGTMKRLAAMSDAELIEVIAACQDARSSP